jgi:hypothetical protein
VQGRASEGRETGLDMGDWRAHAKCCNAPIIIRNEQESGPSPLVGSSLASICRQNHGIQRVLDARVGPTYRNPPKRHSWSNGRVDGRAHRFKATGFVTALEHGMVCGTDVTQTKDPSTSLADVLQRRATETKESREGDFLVGPNEVR